MTEITGGELLARALVNEGVRYVFGLPCPEIDPLLAALEANGIRLVTIRHEAAAVHMAEWCCSESARWCAFMSSKYADWSAASPRKTPPSGFCSR